MKLLDQFNELNRIQELEEDIENEIDAILKTFLEWLEEENLLGILEVQGKSVLNLFENPQDLLDINWELCKISAFPIFKTKSSTLIKISIETDSYTLPFIRAGISAIPIDIVEDKDKFKQYVPTLKARLNTLCTKGA